MAGMPASIVWLVYESMWWFPDNFSSYCVKERKEERKKAPTLVQFNWLELESEMFSSLGWFTL